MSEKALANGTAFPPLEKDKLRLYSMRLCPYAQRTRMVLAHKNIPHETININLKEKPDWFLKRAPIGLVPVLEQNDKIVYESLICDEYLDQVYPQNPLIPKDPYLKARQGILMEMFGSKVVPPFYKSLRATTPEEKTESQTALFNGLRLYEDALSGNFFGGSEVAMVDFHLWPFFERLCLLIETGVIPLGEFPKLDAYFKRMFETKAVKETMFDAKTHMAFYKSFREKNPNYDVGLEE